MKATLPPPEKPAPPQELSLYRELLECLEKEWQALVNSQEEAILALAAQKEHILEKIIALNRGRNLADPGGEPEPLRRLKQQVAETQAATTGSSPRRWKPSRVFWDSCNQLPRGFIILPARWKPPREALSFTDRPEGLSQKTF